MKLKFFILLLTCFGHITSQTQKINEKSPEFQKVLQLYSKAELFNKSKNYKKAAEIYEETVTHFETNFSIEHFYYGLLLNNLAKAYSDNKNYEKALVLFKKALSNTEQYLGKSNTQYNLILNNIARTYQHLEQFKKGISYSKEALANIASNFGKSHIEYAMALNILGGLYFKNNDIKSALSIFIKALQIIENSNATKHPEYDVILNNLGLCYKELGQFNKALFYYNRSLEIIKRTKGKNNTNYITSISNLAGLHIDNKELISAKNLITEALQIIEKIKGKNNIDYSKSLSQLAEIHKQRGQFKKAQICYKEALDIVEKTLGSKHSEYASAIGNLASIYDLLKEHDNALPLREEALKLSEDIYGRNNISYSISLNNLASTLKEMKRYNEALPYLKELNDDLLRQIETSFLLLSEKERENFIANIMKQRLDEFLSFNFKTENAKSEVSELALNNILISKGLLLNSTQNILSELESLNDNLITKKINDLRIQKSILSKQLILPINDRKININEAEKNIQSNEIELLKLYENNFGNYTLIKDFKKNKLKKNEIAIEFKRFKDYTNNFFGIYQYVAYIYHKNTKKLKVVNLFEERQLKKYITNTTSPNQLYKTRGAKGKTTKTNTIVADSIYHLVWKPLEEHLKDSKTIYYSPDGLLHKIPFAALPNSENKLLGEIHDLNLMGNTSNIRTNLSQPNLSDAVLIGGIDYNYVQSDKAIIEENQFSILESEQLLGNTNNKKISAGNSTWSYLSGTQKEIESIKELLPLSKLLSKKKATETTFKNLSGNSPSVIHIATHGYFFPDLEITNKEQPYRKAENPLLRTGLLFANANYAWQNGNNPYEEDDGILTALEISNLDLKNTDIVILSACETGLGDIEGSEGVYGLQRAFKMAGVKTIIMSLWEVPDTETAEFMELFYTHWKAKNNPKKAFKEAQKLMMSKYRGNPEKWAAFVLFE